MTEKALEDRVRELNKSILDEADIDEQIQSFADMIVEGIKLDPKYNPSQDIDWFISTLPKPDVLVIIENRNTHVYSNQPDGINNVVVCFNKKDDRYIEIVSPKNISGKSNDWVTALWGNDPRLTPDKFYKQFMINNT